MTIHDLLPRLPSPTVLHQRAQAFAVLDRILTVDYQRHGFTPLWAPNGADLANMDNGSGDNYTIVFDPAGTLVLGFDHESPATPWREDDREHWPGLLDDVPEALQPYLKEPAFLLEDFLDVTECAWHNPASGKWQCGPVEFDSLDAHGTEADGATYLFSLLADGSPQAYADWAEDYFEINLDQTAVAAVLSGQTLTPQLASALNPDMDYTKLAIDVTAMGYPGAS